MHNKYTSSLLALAENDYRLYFVYNANSHNLIYTNSAFQSFFSPTDNVSTPKQLFDLVHLDDKSLLKELYESMHPGEVKHHIEFRMLIPEKQETYFRLSLYLNDYDIKEKILTGCMENITTYVEHDKSLNELHSKKNSILNIISHDLAGPLGSIKNFSSLLARQTKSLENQQINKFLDAIERNTKKCLLLIQEFIQIEFIESVGIDLVKTRCNLVEKIEDLIQEYQRAENLTKINFLFDTSHPEIYVEMDETKFMQVINNLISNSIKFTPDDGEICVGLEDKDQTALITVTDTGIGIPQKFHAGLFDKFNHARRTGLKGEPSVGLGMSIIKTIVEWHNGKIWFESEENKGTTFFIELFKN